MNRYGLEPGGRLAGRVGVPADKSISHRVLLLAALAARVSHVGRAHVSTPVPSLIRIPASR